MQGMENSSWHFAQLEGTSLNVYCETHSSTLSAAMGGKPCMQHEEGLLADLVQPFGVHAGHIQGCSMSTLHSQLQAITANLCTEVHMLMQHGML